MGVGMDRLGEFSRANELVEKFNEGAQALVKQINAKLQDDLQVIILKLASELGGNYAVSGQDTVLRVVSRDPHSIFARVQYPTIDTRTGKIVRPAFDSPNERAARQFSGSEQHG